MGRTARPVERHAHGALDAEKPQRGDAIAVAHVRHDNHDEYRTCRVRPGDEERSNQVVKVPNSGDNQECADHQRKRDAVNNGEIEFPFTHGYAEKHEQAHKQRAGRGMRTERRSGELLLHKPERE